VIIGYALFLRLFFHCNVIDANLTLSI
jgi:hypothetical protein